MGGTEGRVLVVCTGNVCRSPYVERLLTAFVRGAGVVVGSAGTGALVGRPMDPSAAAQLRWRGGDPTGFVARRLDAEQVAEADLVLGVTREHRAAAATLHPPALRRTFTLGDLADLLAAVPVEELRAATPAERVRLVGVVASRRRSQVPPRAASEVDVADPYGRPVEAFAAMADQVGRFLPAVARALAG